jgi:hypothetical protein
MNYQKGNFQDRHESLDYRQKRGKVECFQLWDGWGGYGPPFVNDRTFRICQPARQAFLGAFPMFYR